jgi:parallel beta-helix repeat protein
LKMTNRVQILHRWAALAAFGGLVALLAAAHSIAVDGATAYVAPPYTCSANYYVSKGGNDSGDGKSPASAWLTIGRAVAVLAGDGGTHGGVCVNVGDGEYKEAVYATGLSGSGDRPNGYMVFRSEHLHGATVQVPLELAVGHANGSFRLDDCNYVVIDGFNLVGQVVPGSDESGVVVTNRQWLKPPEPAIHHVKVLNNDIRHHGGAGVGAVHADYLVVEGNSISDTSRTSPYEVSGISTWEAVASDHAAGFHNIIKDNVIFDNGEVDDGHPTHTDGNGIIIDDFRNTQNGSTYGAYEEQSLVENNLVYSNGGAGIHLYLSDRVTVRNNTCEGNMRDSIGLGTWRAEINVVNGSHDIFVNNIAAAVQAPNQWHAANVALMDNSTDLPNIGNVWKCNLSFNGTAGQPATMLSKSGSSITEADGNILGVDPLFRSPASHDFTLQPSSPAIGKGTNSYGFPVDDLTGRRRTGAPDLGAFAFRASRTRSGKR